MGLQTEIAKIITGEPSKMEDGTDDPVHEMDIDNNMDDAEKVIAKIREVVEGAELTDENPYNGEALKIRHRNATLKKGKLLTRQDIYEAGAEALKQAILKAMGGTDGNQ